MAHVNGPAYRAATLQGICARLDIRLIYCRPYAPEGKGKLERWHRTFRDQFLSELEVSRINDLDDLNARLWAWIEQVYHRTAHSSLDGKTVRLVVDPHVQQVVGVEDEEGNSLGTATPLDALANCHRRRRKPAAANTTTATTAPAAAGANLVELAFDQHYAQTSAEKA